MSDEGNQGQAMETLLADVISESEGATEGEKPEVEADAGTGDEAEGKSDDAGDDASATDAEGDKTGDEPEGEDEKPKKHRSGIDRLKRRLSAAEAELSTLRSRAPRDGEVTREAIIAEIGAPPKEDEFKGDFLAFERALTAYELDARQAVREMRKESAKAQTARAEARREAAEDHQERVEEFRKKVSDFDKTLAGASHLKTSPAVEDLVIESDQSAHLLYYFAKNPERLNTLNRMTEREAAREIGRIEAKLSLPTPKTVTQAAKPITPPKGGAKPRSAEAELDGWLKKTYRGRG